MSYTVENIITFFSSISLRHCNNEIDTNKISLKLTPQKLYIPFNMLKPHVHLKELFSKEMCVGGGGGGGTQYFFAFRCGLLGGYK